MTLQESIIKNLFKNKASTRIDLYRAKKRAAKEFGASFPSNISLLKSYHELNKKRKIKKSKTIESLLKTSPIRSLSGIVNISLLTKPYYCPGKCVFCPLESGIPKSYVSGEPAVERAKALGFHPYLQIAGRIKSLLEGGHSADKIEVRIVGGTWSYYPKNYQRWFVKECFRACNDFNTKTKGAKKESREQYLNTTPAILKKEQSRNEKGKYRIVGISIETRPDYINPEEIKQLRELGVTLVELGVQSLDNSVLNKNVRGHDTKATALATEMLKNAGFKVLYQMMPDLPGSTKRKDLKMFENLFADPDFRPDLLKIYPCAILKDAPLYKLWKKGKYKPYTQKQLTELLLRIKKTVPYYVRIQRIIRDIPSPLIMEGGAKMTSLRQELKSAKCRCIRCREVKENYDFKEKVFLFRQDYIASSGKEIFLSFENKDRTKLYSLLRLRVPLKPTGAEDLFLAIKNAALIREIHTYGQVTPIKQRGNFAQHKGLGKKMVKMAELIAKKEFNKNKIAVISGIGARNYWRKLGYKLKNTYLVKSI